MLILGIVILVLFVLASMPIPSSLSDNSNGSEKNKESFMGGYYMPYDYPFYYPMFYTGCNEDVFGNIGCLW